MIWASWGVTHKNRSIFWASRIGKDPQLSGDLAYTAEKDKRRFRSLAAAQTRADELNGKKRTP